MKFYTKLGSLTNCKKIDINVTAENAGLNSLLPYDKFSMAKVDERPSKPEWHDKYTYKAQVLVRIGSSPNEGDNPQTTHEITGLKDSGQYILITKHGEKNFKLEKRMDPN